MYRFIPGFDLVDLSSKLEKLFGPNLCFKYQLPNEDLDTLISVTCDDDVENLIEEYDRNEARDGTSRLRAFLFPKMGGSMRDNLPCTCHMLEESRCASEQKPSDVMHSLQPHVADCHFHSPVMISTSDYLQGYETACNIHGCRQHHHEGDCQISPRRLVEEKVLTMRPVKPVSPTAMQKEYSRQLSSKLIDSGGRGPALTTSALGPLVSNHNQPSWDRRKIWDEGVPVNPRVEEKWQIDLNNEGHHYNQQDVINGSSMVRVPSKDRLATSFMELTAVDPLSGFDRQIRAQSISRQDLHSDVLEDCRQDGHFQGNARHYKPPDSQRVPPELQWGIPQSVSNGFHAVGIDNRKESGDSDEASHKVHPCIDNVPLVHPVGIPPEGSHAMKLQEPYRHEDPVVKQSLRHSDYEAPIQQYDTAHHLGKSHFQQVHWQLHEAQDQQSHPITSLEPLRAGHNGHGIQRHGQLLDFHPSPAGHHHHMVCTSNGSRPIPRTDAPSIPRVPSPLYRQAASGGSRPDPPSPRRGQVSTSAPLFTPRHGVKLSQKHEVSYLPPGKAQHSSGLPSSQAFVNGMEQHGIYDQSANQAHLIEKGSLANFEPSAQYFDKDGSSM
ncbi:hypothetical protein KP509_09G068200 [Ceratopteris richardii]|uniref:PB1 domain-containing protein n=1 Tax=Ceratopteris richardii TaxID=49495 RepID=A0A8T2U5N5_CERRI|nr:hypothetical protein KP509_09G068200 [Ceratopteris richardii]